MVCESEPAATGPRPVTRTQAHAPTNSMTWPFILLSVLLPMARSWICMGASASPRWTNEQANVKD